jgi:cytochrome c oxidase subunit 4
MAMVVATIKALLVCAFFMHLKFDKLFNTLVFFMCMVMVAYFLMMAILDSGQYQPDIERRAETAATAS